MPLFNTRKIDIKKENAIFGVIKNPKIFDIFSKKQRNPEKDYEKNKVRIIADIHEKNSLVIPNLIELGAEVNILALKVGDYLINNIAIERKTASDFISSMLSKRLQEQLNQIQQYGKKLLVIEGDLNIQKNSNINPNAIKGQILAILTHYSIPIIFTKSEKETADYLFLLAKQQIKGIQESSLHSRIPKTKQEQKQYILESFPNIGPKTAKKLLKEFKTIRNIINKSHEELEKVLGKRTQSLIDLLD